MVLLPLLEILSRLVFSRGIPASGPIVQNLTLWVAFLGRGRWPFPDLGRRRQRTAVVAGR